MDLWAFFRGLFLKVNQTHIKLCVSLIETEYEHLIEQAKSIPEMADLL